jgi:hypothetical protein
MVAVLCFLGAVVGATLYAAGLIWVQVKKRHGAPMSEWAMTSVGIVFFVLWYGLIYFFA